MLPQPSAIGGGGHATAITIWYRLRKRLKRSSRRPVRYPNDDQRTPSSPRSVTSVTSVVKSGVSKNSCGNRPAGFVQRMYSQRGENSGVRGQEIDESQNKLEVPPKPLACCPLPAFPAPICQAKVAPPTPKKRCHLRRRHQIRVRNRVM